MRTTFLFKCYTRCEICKCTIIERTSYFCLFKSELTAALKLENNHFTKQMSLLVRFFKTSLPLRPHYR